MTTQMNGAPERERMRGNPGETYEQRFARYANNAGITAGYSAEYAARQRKAAALHANAAAYARRNGDDAAAELYEEMAAAALDAADALEDLADTARQVAEHYTERQKVTSQDPGYRDPGGNVGHEGRSKEDREP